MKQYNFNSIVNEKYGVSEFDNELYKNKVIEIIDKLKIFNNEDIIIIPEISEKIKFNKISINNLNLTWMNKLNIFYTYNYNEFNKNLNGSATISYPNSILGKYCKINNKKIIEGSIFIALQKDTNNIIDLLPIFYHEITHLYDLLKPSNNLGFDIEYSILNRNLEKLNTINKITLLNNVDEIHQLFTICMYYCNETETHAFMETINFDIQDALFNNYIATLKKLKNKSIDINYINFLKYSSDLLYIIFKCKDLLNSLQNIEKDTIILYNKKYSQDISEIYQYITTYDKLFKYLHNKINHITRNSIKLFNYYINYAPNVKNLIIKYQKIDNFSLNEYFKNNIKRRGFSYHKF